MHGPGEGIGDEPPRLGGPWLRVSPAASGEPAFPASLVLHEATSTSGRYVGRRGATETAFLIWDAGTWQWQPPDRLSMSTSTDRLETYRVDLSGSDLSIDVDGQRVHYRRSAEGQTGDAIAAMGERAMSRAAHEHQNGAARAASPDREGTLLGRGPIGGGAKVVPVLREPLPVAGPVRPEDPSALTPDPEDPRFVLPGIASELRPEVFQRFPRFCVADLPDGCYRLTVRPDGESTTYRGTLRVDSAEGSTTASGDLYRFSNRGFEGIFETSTGTLAGAHVKAAAVGKFGRFGELAPLHRLGIPIYPRNRYHSYLKVTGVRRISFGSPHGRCPLRITAEEYRYTQPPAGSFNGTFSPAPGARTVVLSLTSAPAPFGYTGAYYTGTLLEGGVERGSVELGWVSSSFRRCTIEVDTLDGAVAPQPVPAHPSSRAAAAGLAQEDFRTMMASAGWDARIEYDQVSIPVPAGVSATSCWSDANLHNLMASVRRATTDLDKEWRLHLVVVPATMGCSRGIMYDQIGVPREGVASFSDDGYPTSNSANFGTAANQTQRNTPRAFLRSAGHEIVHGFNQVHQEGEGGADNSIMTTTPSVADVLGSATGGAPGVFPDDIRLEVNDHVRHHLVHFPDVAVRPGGLTFGTGHGGQFIPQADRYEFGTDELELTVTALHDTVAVGEPVLVSWTLTNTGSDPVPVPTDLRNQATHAAVTVIDPRGGSRVMSPFVIECETTSIADLQPGESRTAEDRVFWSSNGFAFTTPGPHVVDVAIQWTAREIPCLVRASTTITVSTPVSPVDDSAAGCLLHPQVGAYVALGGGATHLTEAVSRLTAMSTGNGTSDEAARPAALRGFEGLLPPASLVLDQPDRERLPEHSSGQAAADAAGAGRGR